jgi:hypothetical protein
VAAQSWKGNRAGTSKLRSKSDTKFNLFAVDLHLALAAPGSARNVRPVIEKSPDRTRISLVLVAALWASALAILFIGFRLRLKPVLLIGALDAALAFGATTLLLAGRTRG